MFCVDNRHRREEERIEKFLRHVIGTDRILKCQVEFVTAHQIFKAHSILKYLFQRNVKIVTDRPNR